MTESTVGAVLTVVAALVVALFGTSWLNRRNIARLTRAQAGSSEATTFEISDRIARGWLKDLEASLAKTNARLDEEVRARRGAIAYIERLLDWVKDSGVDTSDLPVVPRVVADYFDEDSHV